MYGVSVMAKNKSTSSNRAERLASKRLGHASYSVSVAGIITGVIIAVFVLVLSLDAAA